MNVKESAAFDGEANLILAVCVFFVELCQHGIQAGCLRRDINHVRSYKPTLFLEPLEGA